VLLRSPSLEPSLVALLVAAYGEPDQTDDNDDQEKHQGTHRIVPLIPVRSRTSRTMTLSLSNSIGGCPDGTRSLQNTRFHFISP
jgi:hypothetical protein